MRTYLKLKYTRNYITNVWLMVQAKRVDISVCRPANLQFFIYRQMSQIKKKEPLQTSPVVVKEGQAEVLLSGSNGVFYNAVQEFNRDLSIAVLRLFSRQHFQKIKPDNAYELKQGNQYQDGIVILEALSASGLRSIRYAKEIPGVKRIISNDFSQTAVASICRNIARNNVENLVTASESDASLLMHQHKRYEDRFHAIDLDPYGSPAQFLDSAVQAVKDEGILLITCTDVAVLAGVSPETCYVKYGAVSLKSKAHSEMALRIVLQSLESHSNRYGRYIVPLLSVRADFYVRLFVQVFSSQAMCKQTFSKLAMVYQCIDCKSFSLQPLGHVHNSGKVSKYTLSYGPPVGLHCEHCGGKHQVAGPIWTSSIHNKEFVSALIKCLENEWEGDFHTAKRLRGILTMIQEELEDVPLYYTLEGLSSIVRSHTMSMIQFRSALMNAGYRVSLAHACSTSLKTDAPNTVIWDIMRAWAQRNELQRDKWPEESVANSILEKVPSTEISFAIHPDANPESREKRLIRFQINPERFWGPGSRGKTSLLVNKVEKMDPTNQHDKN